MIIKKMEQGSTEWHKERVGVPSASMFKNIVTMKGEPSKQRKKYLYALAGERIVNDREEVFQNYAMTRGIELEPFARQFFELTTFSKVEQVGLCVHDSGLFSCSPDGLIKDSTVGLEIKCPLMSTHIEYVLNGKLPADYYQQVHGSMLVTGYDKWYFMSYYPDIKPLIICVERDDVFCDKLHSELVSFCEELEYIVCLLSK